MAPTTMKVLKCVEQGKTAVQELPVPKLRDDYILVKVKAVALNPTDWKHISIDALYTPGATVGCDFAGEVVEVGCKVTKPFKKGDRICGVCHGGNRVQPEDGSFGEYALVKGDVFIKTPDNLTDEQAATLGVGITSVGQGMYQTLELPFPGQGSYGKPFLIYGGSTATGTLAIQYAKLSGAQVVTTCSPRNFELVKSLGADAAFDYNDPDVAKKIREYTKDSLVKVFDCIAEGPALKICEEAISSKGGMIACLRPAKHDREDLITKSTLAYSIGGEAYIFFGHHMEARPQDFEFGKKFWDLSLPLLAEGKVIPHPGEIRSGGLESIPQGLEDLKAGRVSGKKLVYRV